VTHLEKKIEYLFNLLILILGGKHHLLDLTQ
jgi:hypothetical protein